MPKRWEQQDVTDPLYMAARIELLQTAINFLLHTAIPPEDANKYIEGISAPVQAADPRIGVAYNKAVEQFLHTFNLARLPKPDR